MAQPGDEYSDPDGGRIVFKQTSGSTGGELLEMEVLYRPNSELPPEHYHPHQEEKIRVLTGTFRTYIDGVQQDYSNGEIFYIPAGVPHAIHNIGDEYAKVNWQVRPALRSEDFHETVWRLSSDDEEDKPGELNLLQLALIVREYNQEFRLKKPPYFIQVIMLAPLTLLAKLRGYKGYYPK